MKNAFVINIEGVSDPKMEFKLNREDLAGCIDIEGSKVTWVKNLEDEEGNVLDGDDDTVLTLRMENLNWQKKLIS